MLLDARTLAMAIIDATALQAIGMGYVWYVQVRDRAVAELTAGSTLSLCGVVLAFARPHLPPVFTHVLANMLVVGGQMLLAFAVGRFVGRRVPPILVVGVPVLTGVVIAAFIGSRLDIRIAAYSLAIAVASGTTAAVLTDVPRGPLRATHWPVGLLFFVQAVLATGRAVWVLIETPSPDLFESNRLQVLWFTQALIFTNLTFIGLVLMMTQRPRLELDRQASYDILTGTLNRRAFERAADVEWARAVRHDLPVAVLILDLDRFKAVNDTHGHEAGDDWLKAFAEMMRGMLKRDDLLCRYGGEEFLILLPQAAAEAAMQTAERICRATESHRLVHRGTEVAVTVSIGVAARSSDHPSLKSVIGAADRALYRAKTTGRNRVEAAGGY